MTAVPSVTEAALAAVLVLSMGRAFFGPAPRHTDRIAAFAWMFAGVLLLVTVVVTRDDAVWRLALTGAAVEAVCIAGWWLRGADGDDGPDADGEPPVDWDEFDRLRDGWSRPRQPLGRR